MSISACAFKCSWVVLLSICIFCRESCEAGKILGCPLTIVKNSALRNDEKILSMLADDGHEVYILADDGYRPPDFLVKSGAKLIQYPRPPGLPETSLRFTLRNLTENLLNIAMSVMHLPLTACESFLNQSDLHERIRSENFDLVYYNILVHCKYGIQRILGDVPSVEYMPFDTFWRIYKRELPFVPSYMVSNMYETGQAMDFKQRVMNMIWTAVLFIASYKMKYDHIQLVRKFDLEPAEPEGLGFVFGGFPLEYPAPILPDLIYLNGILAAQPKPLDSEIESFIHSSGDQGIVIMSFGSMVSEYDEHYGNLIADAFSKMPQHILWKYEGPTPKRLGENTKIVKWFPQTGLLAHNKTKLFITHCGQNSMYETVMFGIPIVAIPLSGDQFQNSARLTQTHNIGVTEHIKTMTVDSLVEAMKEVISNPKYRANAIRLSKFLNDQPLSGKELLLYWVNYTIRHKGVSHLKPYGRHLAWYQFYSIDVALFLIAAVCILIFISWRCCLFACSCCCKRKRVKSKTS